MKVKELTCPCCGETFEKSDAAWTVCLDCGDIFPPGESWVDHGPGLWKATENTTRVWPCNMSINVYTSEDAREKQAEVRNKS